MAEEFGGSGQAEEAIGMVATTVGQRFHLAAHGPIVVSLGFSVDDAGSPTAELSIECAEGGEFVLDGAVMEMTEEDFDDEDFDALDETDLDEFTDADDTAATEQPEGDGPEEGQPAPATLVDPAASPDGEPDDTAPTEQPEGDGTDDS